MPRTKCIVSRMAATLLFVTGCEAPQKVTGVLDELSVVQRDVSHALGQGEVRVNVGNRRHMTVGVVNSPLKALPASRRQARAFEIAQLAYDSYASRASLETVSVAFVVHRSYFGVFNYNDATDHFRFAVGELLVSRLNGDGDKPRSKRGTQ